MNFKMLVSIIVAVVVIAGAGIFFLVSSSDETSDNSEQATTDTQPAETTSELPPDFKPISTNDTAFEAKLVGTTGDTSVTATILFDGKGNAKYTGESAGEKFESYISGSDYIVCNNGTCFKFAGNTSVPGIDLDQFTYSEEDYDDFKSIAEYIGKEDCPAGSCSVWKIVKDDNTSKIYIDDQNRVSQLTTESPDGSFTYTYTYKNVSFVIPKNVQSLPTQP